MKTPGRRKEAGQNSLPHDVRVPVESCRRHDCCRSVLEDGSGEEEVRGLLVRSLGRSIVLNSPPRHAVLRDPDPKLLVRTHTGRLLRQTED